MKRAVRRRVQLVSTLGALLIMTTACSPAGSDLYEQARDVNLAVKGEIASLQLRIFDGEWDVQKYGDIPTSCGADGYRFTFGRSTPQGDGWRLPDGSPERMVDALTEWLDKHGWSEIAARSYSGEVRDLVLEARKPSAYIDLVAITIAPGESRDWVDIDVTSSCEHGSADELADLMFPDGLNGRDWSQPEHPSTEPRFGFATPTPSP